jgi:nitrogen regulatory protein PII
MREAVLRALRDHADFPGVTVSTVRGFGKVVGRDPRDTTGFGTVEMAKIECIVDDPMVNGVVEMIRKHASTGRAGDGKVAVAPLESVVRIRTGESGSTALI